MELKRVSRCKRALHTRISPQDLQYRTYFLVNDYLVRYFPELLQFILKNTKQKGDFAVVGEKRRKQSDETQTITYIALNLVIKIFTCLN